MPSRQDACTLAPACRPPARSPWISELRRNTVATAYGQLVAEGWLTATSGSGTCVANRAAPGETATKPVDDRPRMRYNLRPGSPDLSAFPRAGWLGAARRAMSRAPHEALGYPDPAGRPELRAALAEYLARSRGVRVSPERIVVVAGFAQGLTLLAEALRARGATALAVEAYGQPGHRDLAAACGLRRGILAVDNEGAEVGDLGGLGDADAVLLTPAHQFPLGVALAARRRTQAVQWALDTGGLLIEDDYDGEFRYDRQPLGAMQALAPEHVVYAGTASKSLAPGLRLGWLVVPPRLLEDVIAAGNRPDRQSPTLEQLTLAEFLRSGAYDRHLRRSRLAYRRRRDRLVSALQRHAPQVQVTGIAAGLHALVELPADQSEDEVLARAAGHGLALEGLREYDATGHHPRGPALVVGYSAPPEHSYTAALARLCATLNGRRPTQGQGATTAP